MQNQIIPKVLNLFIPNLLTFLILLIPFISPNSKFIAPLGKIDYAFPPTRAGDVILTSLTLFHESNCSYRFQNVAALNVRPLETFLNLLITIISPNSKFVAPRSFIYYASPPPRADDVKLTSLTLSHETNCSYAFQHVLA